MKKIDIADKEETQQCCQVWYCLAPEFSFLITALSLHITVFKQIVKNSMLRHMQGLFGLLRSILVIAILASASTGNW